MKKLILVLFLFSIIPLCSLAQEEEDLLSLLGPEEPKKEHVDYAFKSSRVIMSHSMEMIRPGVLDFRILHRFGNMNQGAYEFFGLDQASIRLGLDYGISKNLAVGLGRATYKKEMDGFIKYRLIHQSKGKGSIPFSVLGVGGATMSLLKFSDPERKNYFTSRLGFYGQLIVGSKISEGFTLQVSPTVVHRNLVATADDPSDLIALGTGARLRLSKRVSVNVDYYYRFNRNENDGTHNPLSIGLDIETGGHVFQLHFTNAIGMNERIFLTETTNSWARGDIQFGFNISRAFQIKKKK